MLTMWNLLTCIDFLHAGFGATVNVAKPKPNDTVAVFGLGAVGLSVCYISFTASFFFFPAIK